MVFCNKGAWIGMAEEDGVWRTVGGRRVFIKDGQSLTDAMRESGKFGENKTQKHLVPLDSKNVADLKKNMTRDEAFKILEKESGESYRFYGSDDPMSRAGYAMFADDPDRNGSAYGGDNKRAFSVNEEDLTDVSKLKGKIIAARHLADKIGDDLADYKSLSDSDFYEMFDPQDIVDSADAFDNESLAGWFYDRVAEPNQIAGIKTFDGAIVFDKDIIKRNIAAEVAYTQETTKTTSAPQKSSSQYAGTAAQVKEYTSFKAEMTKKYGGRLWSEMTDSEYDKMERLERIAYRGK